MAAAPKVVVANEYADVDLGAGDDVLVIGDDDVAALVVDVGPHVDCGGKEDRVTIGTDPAHGTLPELELEPLVKPTMYRLPAPSTVTPLANSSRPDPNIRVQTFSPDELSRITNRSSPAPEYAWPSTLPDACPTT